MSEDKPKRICKGICKQYKAKRPKDGSRYANGQVRCQICEIYMTKDGCKDKQGNQATTDTDDLFCKCCNYRVRSKPRNRIYKAKYQEQMDKNLEEDSTPMDIEELKNFINIDAKPQANYQFVVIKTLLENNNTSSRDSLADSLKFYNKDKPFQDYKRSMVFSVLEDRNLIIKNQDDTFTLNLETNLNAFDILETITLCNQRIYENKIKLNADYFIALGPWENWNHTIENPPLRWGIADITPSNIAVYDLASEGDIVFYYSTRDEPTFFTARGFFGIGVVRKKEINKDEKYWPEEQRTDKAFFTHKIYLDTLKFAQSDDELIPLSDGLPLVKGFNHITEGKPLDELIENSQSKWNVQILRNEEIPVNYWKIAPGEQAIDWENQKNSGIIGISWKELGDLTGKTHQEVHQKLREIWSHAIANNSPQFRDFLSIKEGDIIIANKGKSKVLGIGKVVGPYKFQEDSEFPHTFPVDWFDLTERDIPQQNNWFITISSVSSDLYNSIMTDAWPKQYVIPPKLEELIKKFDENKQLFDPDWTGIEGVRADREKFQRQFPPERIPSLSLNEYVAGKADPQTGDINRGSFCNVLEGQLDSLGSLWGTYATKFGIFFSSKRNDYFYNSKKFSNPTDALESIKNDITYIIEESKKFTEHQDWNKFSKAIDGHKFTIMRNVVSKIIAVYGPENWILINSNTAVDTVLDYFKIPRHTIQNQKILKKYKLMEIKESHPLMKNWDACDYSHFLWKTIMEKSENDEVEKEDEEVSEIVLEEENFVLLRHNPSFKRKKKDRKYWDDFLGKEYHFGPTVANYTKINPNTKAVWFYTDKENLYFWGFGFVENVTTTSDNKFVASMKNFHLFDEQFDPTSGKEPSAIKASTILQQQIKKPPKWNPFNSIIEIDENLYEQILESEKLDNTFEDKALPFPSSEALEDARKSIKEEILVNDDILNQIFSTLLAGKNILLVGPVGSGKTHLATILPHLGWKEFGGYYSQVYTATADWTTQDVIGGIYPKLDQDDQVMYSIQKGCVAETVAQNWLNETSNSNKRVLVERVVDGKVVKNRGVWLVIDEFNRANIDRAFGQLFTALEYNNLQIPTTDPEKPFEDLLIPKDYRMIGTLNTADKHFLHTLSDALKRRFAIIELPLPTFGDKDTELYYVVKKSLKELEKISTKIKVDDATKTIVSNSDPDAENILNILHLLMTYIREIKPLGTALLISMFRFMITNYTLTNDWQKSLDFALTSTILPQLESLPYWTLKVVRAVCCNDVSNFFKTDPEIVRDGYENYRTDFEHLVGFLKKVNPPSKTILKRFRTSSLTDEDFESLKPWTENISKPSLSNFRNAITAMIEEKGFTEESEIEDE